MIPGSANPLLLASAAEAADYQIERSLRFNSADSYLNWTPASAGNRKTWTLSLWLKKTTFARGQIISNGNAGNNTGFYFEFFDDSLRTFDYASGSIVWRLRTSALFRDPSAWYAVQLTYDTTQATSTDRIKLYVNGSQITTFASASYPSQNYDGYWNGLVTGTTAYGIGGIPAPATKHIFNGYFADIHFVDGQALDPTGFGEFDDNGIWQPIEYTGTYGTNGFHLDFADNSSASALGYDAAGSNDWTVNNLSVTAGAGNDSLVDSPTNYGTDTGAGGEVRGNYCTLNTVVGGANVSDITFSNGNLEATWASGGGNYAVTLGTIGVSSGKWYWETTIAGASNFWIFGIATAASSLTNYIGAEASSYSYYNADGNTYNNGSSTVYGNAYTTNDVIGVALDLDNGRIFFSKNGTWQNSGSPTGGTNAAYTGLSGTFFPAYSEGISSAASAYICNFGQRPFAYTAPSGFKALCTANLPSTTITTSGSYTGNGVADGPFVYLNGVPTAMTVDGNSITFGTNADKLSNGFKIRTTSTTYNQNASTYNYTITSTGAPFKTARAQPNP